MTSSDKNFIKKRKKKHFKKVATNLTYYENNKRFFILKFGKCENKIVLITVYNLNKIKK